MTNCLCCVVVRCVSKWVCYVAKSVDFFAAGCLCHIKHYRVEAWSNILLLWFRSKALLDPFCCFLQNEDGLTKSLAGTKSAGYSQKLDLNEAHVTSRISVKESCSKAAEVREFLFVFCHF